MVTTVQMVQGLDRQIEQVTLEAAALQRLQRGLEGDVARIGHEVEQAWMQLAETLVPALDTAVLDRAAAQLHLGAIGGAVVAEQLRQHAAQQQQRLASLTSESLYTQRETILNTASIRLAEVDEAIGPLLTSTTALENERYFTELLQFRYGTPEYAVKFFQMQFYTHWKFADLIVERHGARMKATDFAGIAARYVDERDALRQLEATRQTQKQVQAAVASRLAAIATTEQAIADAAPRMLSSVRGRVREHLMALDDDDLARLLSFDPAVDLAWRRIAGLKKKQEYLTALAQEQVRGPLGDLNHMRGKLSADRSKLTRPKNASRSWSDAEWQRRFGTDRLAKWRKRRERIEQTRTHIVEFHHYDRWSPASDLLWWDVMTDGRLDGNFIPEVRERPHGYVHHAHDDGGSVGGVGDSFADVS